MPDYETAQRLSAVLLVTTAFLYADDEEIAEALLRLSNMPVRKRTHSRSHAVRRIARACEAASSWFAVKPVRKCATARVGTVR